MGRHGLCLATGALASLGSAGEVRVWVADPLTKVLQSDGPAAAAPKRIAPGKKHRVICERDGSRLSHGVDGKVAFSCLHRDRLNGPGHRHAGIHMYLPGQFVDNVGIYVR